MQADGEKVIKFWPKEYCKKIKQKKALNALFGVFNCILCVIIDIISLNQMKLSEALKCIIIF